MAEWSHWGDCNKSCGIGLAVEITYLIQVSQSSRLDKDSIDWLKFDYENQETITETTIHKKKKKIYPYFLFNDCTQVSL